jgi:hypothetical protein
VRNRKGSKGWSPYQKTTVSFSSAPTKLSSGQEVCQKSNICELKKFQYKAAMEEPHILNFGGERVHGLSGEGISISEEDIISDEAQGSQTTTLDSKGSQTQSVVKCSYADMVLNKQTDKVESPIFGGKVEEAALDRKLVEFNETGVRDGPTKEMKLDDNNIRGVHANQISLGTRHSSRIQKQFLEKQHGVELKKRHVEGNLLVDKNSFALLDNDLIVDLANEMGVVISDKEFGTVDLMKDLEIARQALEMNKGKFIKNPMNVRKYWKTINRLKSPYLSGLMKTLKQRTSPWFCLGKIKRNKRLSLEWKVQEK